MPRVVWAEESETGLGFEIGANYNNVPTMSHCATNEQFSCICNTFAMLIYTIPVSSYFASD